MQSSFMAALPILRGKSPTLVAIVGIAAAVNVGSFGLFWYDKRQAVQRGWRVPEKTLQLSALCGGWMGGMFAMQTFRHKTKKEPFRTIYFGCVAVNVAAVAVGSVLVARRPGLARQLMGGSRQSPSVQQYHQQQHHHSGTGDAVRRQEFNGHNKRRKSPRTTAGRQ